MLKISLQNWKMTTKIISVNDKNLLTKIKNNKNIYIYIFFKAKNLLTTLKNDKE